jgi:hypothetical protein
LKLIGVALFYPRGTTVWIWSAFSDSCRVAGRSPFAQSSPQLVQLDSPRIWKRAEFRVDNVPSASNPSDPDFIRLDATFVLPSWKTMVVPAFWYQAYQRSLQNGSEKLIATGAPEWRVHFTPAEASDRNVRVSIFTNGQPFGALAGTNFTVAEVTPPGRLGFVRVAESNQYFETSDGSALPLIGANVCWPGSRGTYDYDDWFAAMHNASENYVRLWMCPWALGIETDTNSLTNYRLDRAWQLDYVFTLAEQIQIYLLFCLDYHGMFETQPDIFGGNNYWPKNPYSTANGGP